MSGAAVAAGDYDGDRYADVAAGAPGAHARSGGIRHHEADEEPPCPGAVR
ncbi:FG-GAP repeat protein [Streptomyces sp. 061-3]